MSLPTSQVDWRSSDEELSAAMRFAPSRVADGQYAATALYRQADALIGGPTETVRDYWRATQAASFAATPRPAFSGGWARPGDRADSDVALLRIALRAGAWFRELLALDPADLATVRDQWQPQIANTPAARAILSKTPALAAWLADRDHRAAEAAASQRAAMEAAQAALPATLLATLRRRGIVLELDRGSIVLAPADAARTEPHELDQLRDHKAAIVTILKAEHEAAPKPLRI